jgi:hypothetical protein
MIFMKLSIVLIFSLFILSLPKPFSINSALPSGPDDQDTLYPFGYGLEY